MKISPYYPNTFKPTAPVMISDKKTMRFQPADSPKNKAPIKTAPAAPNPVQMAYAVPIGMSRIASAKKMKPNVNETTISNNLLIDFFCMYKLMLITPNISPKLAMTR